MSLQRAFADVAAATMRFRDAVRAAIGTRPGPDASSRKVAMSLGLEKHLGWQVFRLRQATDPADVFSALPGRPGVQILVAALRQRGGAPGTVEEVEAAYEALLETLASRNISPTQMKALAAGGLDDAAQRRALLRIQRKAHDARVALRGAGESIRIRSFILTPARSKPGMVDAVAMCLVHGLVRTRPTGPIETYTRTFAWDRESGISRSEMAGHGTATDMPAFVPEASTPDLKPHELCMLPATPGNMVFADPDRPGPLDLAFLEQFPDFTSQRLEPGDGPNSKACLSSRLHISCAWAVLDVLVHRDLPALSFRAGCFLPIADQLTRWSDRELQRFPSALEVELRRSPELTGSLRTANEPYARLLRIGLGRAGAEPADFALHRVVMQFPPTPSSLRCWWELPPARAEGA